MIAPLVNVALGLWLMAAPAVLAYGGAAATSDRIAGPIIASIAAVAVWDATRVVGRANALLGAWPASRRSSACLWRRSSTASPLASP